MIEPMPKVTAEEAHQMKVLSINLKVACAHSELSEELIGRVLREVADYIDPQQ